MAEDTRKDRVSEVAQPYEAQAAPDIHNGQPRFEEPVSEAGKRVTEEEYWAHYYEHPDFSYEWNDGILEEKPVSDFDTTTIYYWFLRLLGAYLDTHPIAQVLLLEFGIRLALPHKTTIRKPDLFVVRNDNPLALKGSDRSYRGICDLAVEALSDSTRQEKERDTVVKYGEYAGIGIREYYILHTDEGNLGFYRLNRAGEYEDISPTANGVIRSEVLPDFQFRIEDLLHRPSLVEMATDPVYQSFVMPEYAAAQQRAEEERQRAARAEIRAEEERQRAEEERQRAERFAARLRELGIDVDEL